MKTARSAGSSAGELAVESAHPEVRAVLERCEDLRRETRRLLRRRGHRHARSVGLRQGLCGRPRAPSCSRPRGCGTTRSMPPVTSGWPDSHSLIQVGGSASSIRSSTTGSRPSSALENGAVATSADLRPGRPRARPAHRRSAVRCALGHDHGPGSRHRRRVRDRSVCDGGGRPGVDRPAERLRGADDPRRPARA